MRRIGAPIEPAPLATKRLFDPATVEEVFRVRECAFDAVKLKDIIAERARLAGVEVRLNTPVLSVRPRPGGSLRVDCAGREVVAGMVFCCGYAQLNTIAANSGLPIIPLKHELAEMALAAVPPQLKGLGITVMDGPFFSCMPFPSRGLHTLSHVRYTPHGHWFDSADAPHTPAAAVLANAAKITAFPAMVRAATTLVPLMARCEYRDSLWAVKTVLPRSETDDSRPILFRPHHGVPNYHAVMGGKIDNVYDVADEIAAHLGVTRTQEAA
jgi:glycine/D-amino acid oxidase-like deaminating enzyme